MHWGQPHVLTFAEKCGIIIIENERGSRAMGAEDFEVLVELVKSLNAGGSGYIQDRVRNAVAQLREIKEECGL